MSLAFISILSCGVGLLYQCPLCLWDALSTHCLCSQIHQYIDVGLFCVSVFFYQSTGSLDCWILTVQTIAGNAFVLCVKAKLFNIAPFEI